MFILIHGYEELSIHSTHHFRYRRIVWRSLKRHVVNYNHYERQEHSL